MRVDLTGQIERITYTNPENGYTIAQVKVRGEKRVVTVVGNLIEPLPGEIVELQGQWKIHPKYGEQFEVQEYRTTVPATIHGIKKYLGSGLIKGIGPVMAGRIVSQFGKKTLDIIENKINRLSEIDGIGDKRIEMIQAAWEEQKEIRSVMMFLQSHQVSVGYATKIFKQYGDRSITVVTENPYQMATDIFGIGFITADKIAANLGFSKDSPQRIRSGILYVLNELSGNGHVYYPYPKLIEKCFEILDVAGELVAEELMQVASDKQIVIETEEDALSENHEDGKGVYLSRYHFCETGISYMLKRLMATPKVVRPVDANHAVKWVQKQLDFSLAENQKKAILSAVQSKLMVITGGPGTGKTTIIQAVLKIFKKLHVNILLAAPTGRAAKQMSETTGFAARTIHRMLSFNFHSGGFQKNEKDPLDCDLLIVDEASMIDTVLMHHLLKAVPPEATLILVGDVNQLPSVGAGNILGDIIASRVVPVVRLTEIFRQAQESQIIVNAHRINNGFLPKTDVENDDTNDFYFIDQESPERVLEIILELAAHRIPKKFGFDRIDEIQVLSPMHKGLVGTTNLNKELQKRLNPQKDSIVYGNMTFHCHDKVMQIRNNYDKNVFNGDIGRVIDINRETREVIIEFDGRKIVYDFTELDEVVPAYAVSVHKSQGSEYPAVIIPVLTQHYILLQRNLIYTAVTRGRRLVVLVGTKKALAIAINNDKTRQRFTRLKDRLQGKTYFRIIRNAN
ncbi:MAG: ATP-dependent RecD-like DNA helicase [Desulfobacteraceae bacterium]|nr:ATP-dependent RecD-like DNA helicase [Desulfobacteraceae bacterium]MBC2758098.1 ATP-dependent RecD-like DNA helicase [Desulfobacteraceae bacterium]